MSLKSVSILNIKIVINSKEEILEFIKKAIKNPIKSGKSTGKSAVLPLVITTPNPEQVMLASTDNAFAEIINQSDVAIPDGIGLVWSARVLNLPGPAVRVSGIDLMEELIKLAEKQGVRIGLIGGRDGVALEALECLRKKHPGLEGVVWEGPEIRFMNYDLRIKNKKNYNKLSGREKSADGEEEIRGVAGEVATWIIKNRLGMVFVGMGAPKQEFLIREVVKTMGQNGSWFMVHGSWNINKNNKIAMNDELRTTNQSLILMSVGGAFDMIAGRTPRAPVWVREMGLEWLWRLILEPWRLRRQLALLRFAGSVIVERVRSEFLTN